MNGYLEIIYEDSAAEQLQELADSDIRYAAEPEAYEWMIARDPEGLGTPIVVEEMPVYVFRTVRRADDLPPLLISYTINRAKQEVQIVDIRATW